MNRFGTSRLWIGIGLSSVIATIAVSLYFARMKDHLFDQTNGLAYSDPQWTGLSHFKQKTFDDVLRDEPTQVLVYYLANEDTTGVRVDLKSHRTTTAEFSAGKGFLCLIADRDKSVSIYEDVHGDIKGKLRVSTCDSKSGSYDVLKLDIRSRAIFTDQIAVSEVDSSKVLRNGFNVYLDDVYRPVTPAFITDALLDIQKIGTDDFIAKCSALHLTSRDHVGAVDLFQTTIRPQSAGALEAGIGQHPAHTRIVKALHLKTSLESGYRCEQAVTLASGIIFVLSGDDIVVIDYKQKSFGVMTLPTHRQSYVLFRSINL